MRAYATKECPTCGDNTIVFECIVFPGTRASFEYPGDPDEITEVRYSAMECDCPELDPKLLSELADAVEMEDLNEGWDEPDGPDY